MAWSSVALASYETTRLALDKPLIATQAIPVSPSYAKWVDQAQLAAGDITTWTDRSATASPAYRAYDGHGGYVTKTDGVTTDDIWAYCLDLGAIVEFDCAFLIGHNAGTLAPLDNDILIEIADDNDFSTNATTIGNFGEPADDTRVADLDLNHGGAAQRYSAQFVRLWWDGPGDIIPEMTEFVLGRRRQLEYKPNRPYDEYAMSEDAETTLTAGGVTHKSLYSRRGFELAGEFAIDGDTYRDDLVAFYRACRGPFVWVENPSTAPEAWHLMMREGSFSMPRVVANRRSFKLAAMEQGPEAYFLDVETNG